MSEAAWRRNAPLLNDRWQKLAKQRGRLNHSAVDLEHLADHMSPPSASVTIA